MSKNESDTTTKKNPAGIAITERAAKEVQRVIDENKMPGETWVRIGAKGGGCSGMTYVLDFDQKGPTFEEHGVKVIVDKKSSFFMAGTTLDFNDGLLNRGFVFNNPTATGTCGCGTSFST
ncbi:MAG: HesB/IscA family protein [Planctomycetota bacterium]|jgi:iron-sulfur cluster assembly protein